MASNESYLEKKVISIGTVCELTGLSERRIRYYEERKLIFPERSNRGIRKYSFSDVERLMDIANKREEGIQTSEIRKEYNKEKRYNEKSMREKVIRGQLNAYFHQRD
ncbi:MerR family transcriptional regulator [Heyndrickxia acidiproducens]|uniref:MerR family transcriptional regulator n=1 Tax=Heyndrickxia acidiproducens TaxID=1121084 RepID=UPI0003664382|nr:MerR family transcriptional regulator [Heyndrickxia acidiproducens]